jgi:hypothetical protein
MSEAFSATTIVGALVSLDGTKGMTEASGALYRTLDGFENRLQKPAGKPAL